MTYRVADETIYGQDPASSPYPGYNGPYSGLHYEKGSIDSFRADYNRYREPPYNQDCNGSEPEEQGPPTYDCATGSPVALRVAPLTSPVSSPMTCSSMSYERPAYNSHDRGPPLSVSDRVRFDDRFPSRGYAGDRRMDGWGDYLGRGYPPGNNGFSNYQNGGCSDGAAYVQSGGIAAPEQGDRGISNGLGGLLMGGGLGGGGGIVSSLLTGGMQGGGRTNGGYMSGGGQNSTGLGLSGMLQADHDNRPGGNQNNSMGGLGAMLGGGLVGGALGSAFGGSLGGGGLGGGGLISGRKRRRGGQNMMGSMVGGALGTVAGNYLSNRR